MTAIGHDQEPPVDQLTGQSPGVIDRAEWVSIPGHDEGRRVDAPQVARRQERLGPDVGGEGRQQPAPCPRTLTRVVPPTERRGEGRVVPIDPRRVHEATGDRCAWLTLGADADDDERPNAIWMTDSERERRHRPHREPDEVEGVQPQGVGEGRDVGDEHVKGETLGGVPATPSVAPGIREEASEGAPEGRQLGREVLSAGRRGAVERDERRTGPDDLIGLFDPVGDDRWHSEILEA